MIDNEVEIQAWDRLEGETLSAWAAFEVYRDLGKSRSLALAAQSMGRPPGYKKTLEPWSSKYNWVERCVAYDAFFDRVKLIAEVKSKSDLFHAKKQAQFSDRERIGRTLVNVSLRMIQLLQYEISERLRNPVPMKTGEMAALFKASVSGLELGSLMVDQIITIEQEQEGETTQRDIIVNSADPESLAREYRRLIDGTN